MTATKRLKEVRKEHPEFEPGWQVYLDGVLVPHYESIDIVSRFGGYHDAVVVDSNGKPLFDKTSADEAPNVNCIAYGYEKGDGSEMSRMRIGMLHQPRPHADDPEQPGSNDHEPVVFCQVPMGFIDKLTGEELELPEDAAVREVFEETGAGTVRRVHRPGYPWHSPNPTFVTSWSDLCFVEVDLERIEALKSDRSEPIYSAEYRPISVWWKALGEGKDYAGAVQRSCTSNSVLGIFLATMYPDIFG